MLLAITLQLIDLPGGGNGKEPTCQCRGHKRAGSISGLGRSPGEGYGNPLQYSCLKNPMDRGAWRATPVTKGQTRLNWAHMHTAATTKSLQSCPTLCDPVPGILQARTLEWVAISFSSSWKGKVKVKSLSHVQLFATPWTAACQAPPSMGFSRQEYWSGILQLM